MSRLYKCDNCGREFPQAIDFVEYKDEHGVWYVIDLCAPCRGELKEKRAKPDKDFLGKIVKAKK